MCVRDPSGSIKSSDKHMSSIKLSYQPLVTGHNHFKATPPFLGPLGRINPDKKGRKKESIIRAIIINALCEHGSRSALMRASVKMLLLQRLKTQEKQSPFLCDIRVGPLTGMTVGASSTSSDIVVSGDYRWVMWLYFFGNVFCLY